MKTISSTDILAVTGPRVKAVAACLSKTLQSDKGNLLYRTSTKSNEIQTPETLDCGVCVLSVCPVLFCAGKMNKKSSNQLVV